MGLKGIALGAYALCFGGLLLFSNSGVVTGLGVALITIACTAIVSRLHFRRASPPRG
ncbi:hypothetical protein [Halobellus captivus]|uniref:hypothetical protein n=1 Tax=Halobellus captivus TaxID=2592614 RepID=UPI0013967F94|nr:hypothetical protein [Halobellus captivus]